MNVPATDSGPTAADVLTLESTALANERTMLAYVQTALALGGAGFSLIEFFPMWPGGAGGIVLSVLGVGVLAVGTFGFLRVRRRVRSLRSELRRVEEARPAPP